MLEVPHNVKIYSAAPYFYNLKKKVGYTVRYIVRFDEEINGDALKKAFESTMKRYPYLRLKLVKGLFSDHLEYNDAPLVVLNTSEALTLGEKQTNGHLHYCLLRYNEPIEMDNVNLEGSEMDPEEYREPFMQKLPKPLKQLLCKIMFSVLEKPTTYTVNYSGKTTYGSCDKHIRGLYPETTYVYDQRCTLLEV